MQTSNKIIKFGEDVDGYDVPVLNEREIRASAGIMFLALLVSLMFILFKQDFLMVKYVIVIFLTDFMIRVLINPKYSPVLIIGRLVVSRQVPEYVGAAQKKFAWKIGLVLAGLMFLLMVVLNSYSIFTGATCLICLLFLFFESAFGICIGCWFYSLLYKNETSLCAGEICKKSEKQAIQKTSWIQVLIVLGSVAYVLLTVMLFNEDFRTAPKNLKEIVTYLP